MSDYLMHFNRNHDKNGRFTRGDGDGKPNKKSDPLRDIRNNTGKARSTKWWVNDKNSGAVKTVTSTASNATSRIKNRYEARKKISATASNVVSKVSNKVEGTFNQAHFSGHSETRYEERTRKAKDFVSKVTSGAKSYDKAYKNSDNVSKAVSAGKNYVSRIISAIEEAKKKKKKKKKQFTKNVTPKFTTVSTNAYNAFRTKHG